MKSATRILAEKVKAKYGVSLIMVNYYAQQLVNTGLYNTKLEALKALEAM